MHDIDSDTSRVATHPSELDVTTLPPWAQEKLFRAVIDATKRRLAQPGGSERLDALTAARMARKAAAAKAEQEG